MDGKVALVTGAARGIGAATARLLASEGAPVAVTDVNEIEGRAVTDEITSDGGRAKFVRLDVSNADDWARAVAATIDAYGRLDVLVNNAGIYSGETVESVSIDEWDAVMEVNAKGAFLGTRAVLPAMRQSGGGSIVNISSTTGLVGREVGGAYGASKAAIRLLTKYTAVQHAQEGVRANSVHPGAVETQMIAANLSAPGGRATSVSRVPMGRLGSVDDVANAVLFLASDEASYVTGAELVIDGGMTAQ